MSSVGWTHFFILLKYKLTSGESEELVTRKKKATDTDHLYLCLAYFRKEKPALIFEILQRLSELRRFDMAVMFMSGPERKSKFWEGKLYHSSSSSSAGLLRLALYTYKIHTVKYKLLLIKLIDVHLDTHS